MSRVCGFGFPTQWKRDPSRVTYLAQQNQPDPDFLMGTRLKFGALGVQMNWLTRLSRHVERYIPYALRRMTIARGECPAGGR